MTLKLSVPRAGFHVSGRSSVIRRTPDARDADATEDALSRKARSSNVAAQLAPGTEQQAVDQPTKSAGRAGRLVLDGVAHDFRTRTGTDVPAIESVDLTIDPGQFVAIVGPSGCGKTTLLRIAGGLISPSRGTVRYRGEAISGPVDDLGIVFQAHELLEWRTVLKNITIQSEIRRLGSPEERRAQALDLLRRVHLEGYEGRYPFELSGGQQQRVALCRALIHDPGMLLMDEPFGALDAFTREQLQADLESMWMLKRPTVIFITHDVTEAVTLADRVVVMTGSLPGRLAKSEVNVPVERPRRGRFLEIPELQQCALKIRQILTTGVAAERV